MDREFPFDQDEFQWRDGERTILFGGGGLAAAADTVADRGWGEYELLSTARALAEAPDALAGGAAAVHVVPGGAVPAISAELLERVAQPNLVALGGGRVIDTAKAIGSVRGGRVCAIPTTLSGAPMTTIHRLPEGAQAAGLIRPALVIADPVEMTGQPEERMRASAMNALAHGSDSLWTPLAHPVSRQAGLAGTGLIASALDQPRAERDRAALAIGALLCAFALDSALFALHHVICQTLVRVLEIPHAETNATILPRVLEAMRGRAPAEIAALAASLGTDPAGIGPRVDGLGGGRRRLADLGADSGRLEDALDAIQERGELKMTPDSPDRDELRRILEAAW
ncbi:MAG TPA: iron-containing alcohol dehydrogenase [Solirubrobacterales bacterium]